MLQRWLQRHRVINEQSCGEVQRPPFPHISNLIVASDENNHFCQFCRDNILIKVHVTPATFKIKGFFFCFITVVKLANTWLKWMMESTFFFLWGTCFHFFFYILYCRCPICCCFAPAEKQQLQYVPLHCTLAMYCVFFDLYLDLYNSWIETYLISL